MKRKFFRFRNCLEYPIEYHLYIFTRLRRDRDNIFSGASEKFDHLSTDAIHIGTREINLIQNRDNREVIFERKIDIGKCLRLNPLRRIDDEDRSFDRREAA